MSQQNDGSRIAREASMRHSPLRRRWLIQVLLVQLTIIGGGLHLAQAQVLPSPYGISACRPSFVRLAAEEQETRPRQAGIIKGVMFIRAAVLHLIAGNYERAVEQYDHAISLNPENPSFYIGRRMAHLTKREFGRAVDDFSQAIALNPNSHIAFFGRGYAYDGMSEYGHAIEDLGEAIKLFSGNAAAYVIRGDAYTKRREYDRAIEDIDQAIKLDPYCSTGFTYRGIAYELKGEQERAMADYSRAIELDPNPRTADALIRRGNAYRKKHDYDRAIQDFTQALKLNPKDPVGLNNRCYTRAIVGALDEPWRIATSHCGYDPTMPPYSTAAASPTSRWVRSTTQLPITMLRSALNRKRQSHCMGVAQPNG
jgi:tetratricopeptide (TPR) repeat protein